MKNIIVWFRKDLRMHDNLALWQAGQEGNIIPIFIWSATEEKDYQASEASLWWLHHSLLSLEKKLNEKGLQLIYKSGKILEELTNVIKETDADGLFYNERYEPTIIERDEFVSKEVRALGVEVRSFDSYLLFPPYDIKNKQNKPYKVFTSFYKNVLQRPVPRPVPYPEVDDVVNHNIKSSSIEALNLLPDIRWDKKLYSYWEPGEEGAIKRFEVFEGDGLKHYEKTRNIPSENSVSLLSPYLTWGNISVRAMWHAIERDYSEDINVQNSLESFKRQLIWRDFAYHQLIHFPSIIAKPLREQFEHFPWLDNNGDFNKWKKGMTGYPLVDAGMRELMETGVIHNRVRMIVASFLIKHLLINWTKGYDWFSETLVDFDVANNASGWQWVAGSGVETAPYFRIFNPILQSEKFDAEGYYIRKWIPELRELPSKHIHEPWKAPKDILAEANIELNVTYPLPIIDHKFARKRALAAFDQIKNNKKKQ